MNDPLAPLHAAGLTARLDDQHSAYGLIVAPRSAITPALRAYITEHKAALVDALYAARVDAAWPPLEPETAAQRWARTPVGVLAVDGVPAQSHYVFADEDLSEVPL